MPTPARDTDDDVAQATVETTDGLRTNAFGYPNFRIFFGGQLIAVTGMWMQSLAMSWLLVQTLHASALELGLLQVFQFGPVAVLGIPAGILADRFPKRKILVVTQIIYMIAAAVLAWLVLTGRVQLWQVYAVSMLTGVVNSLDMPARQAIISELIDPPALKNAIAMNAAMFNLGRLLGPSLAGVVLATWGAGACFLINAVTYLGPITAYLVMSLPDLVAEQTGSALDKLRAGIGYIKRTPAIMLPMFLVGWVTTVGINHGVWMPLLATESLHADERTYGILFSAMGVGALAGSLVIGFSKSTPNFRRVLIAASGMAASLIGIGLAARVPMSIPVMAVLLAMNGYFFPNTFAAANTIIQTLAPADMRGRVMAVYTTIFLGTAPLGGLSAGWLCDAVGVEMAMVLAGGLVVAAVVTFGWLAQRVGLLSPAG